MPILFLLREKGVHGSAKVLVSGSSYGCWLSPSFLGQGSGRWFGSVTSIFRWAEEQVKGVRSDSHGAHLCQAGSDIRASSFLSSNVQMASRSLSLAGVEMGAGFSSGCCSRSGLASLRHEGFIFLSRVKGVNQFMRVSARLDDGHSSRRNMIYRNFWTESGMLWSPKPYVNPCTYEGPGSESFHSSSLLQQSAGAAHDISFDGAIREEQHETTAASSGQTALGDRTLKLFSGSCYLPHPDKEETGGEDAHFICEGQAIGVADGVGGWADLGVDSGEYARQLMSHSQKAIKDEPKGAINPSRVLEKAYMCTKARGSSTACIIALTDQGLHAVNLGDSGFIVVREGCTVFRSPVQQHDFNFTYQLQSDNGSDLPSSAQVFTVEVAPGDVIIAGTDGLFDNLYNNEVTAVVVHAIRAGLGPQVTAQKIAALARQRAQDKNRQTPFSTSAQDAGYRYYGGKLDDITVVVSYITASSN